MSRSQYVYTVCFFGSLEPLAAFTVKYEAQIWAEVFCKKADYRMDQISRFRYRDDYRNGERVEGILTPWVEVKLNQHPSNPANCPMEDGDPRVKEIKV